jgi:dihydrofolate synthase/folylpolyglutamate synthase
MVDAALRRAGHKSARYTSPHLLDLAERFVVDGHPADRDALDAVITHIRDTVDHLRRSETLDAPPTFFEVTTAIAFELFRRSGVDVAVCEVGMGGRLDATNVLQPVATAITTIGLDHQQYLGGTLSEIAREKAGIIKHGIPVVVGKVPASALAAIDDVARDHAAPVVRAADDVVASASTVGSGFSRTTRLDLRTPVRRYDGIRLALAGAHQIDNAIVAVRLLEVLDQNGLSVPVDAVIAGLEQVTWPGRLETRRFADGREVLLDAAHNLDGASSLAAFLEETGERTRPLVFASMRDKDAAGMLRTLLPAIGALVVTRASNPRSADPAELGATARAVAPELRIVAAASARDALAAAWALSPRIVVAGSIFLLADVMKELDGP